MPVPPSIADRLVLPVIAAPMFIVSGVDLVVAQCTAGVLGTLPSLNAREATGFDSMLGEIEARLDAYSLANRTAKVAPYGVNLIVHKTNVRLAHDLDVCVRRRVPLVITSLGTVREIVDAVHAYGGLVFHDVTTMRHARKALEAGVDGIIAVCAGAGGHAGALSPIALLRELRAEFTGPIALSGAIADGYGILGALALGADFAYVGSRFIATAEATAPAEYKRMIVDGSAADIIYTSAMTGVPANYLRPSMLRVGLDPDQLVARDGKSMSFADGSPRPKAWKDVWGCGQGLGVVHDVPATHELVTRWRSELGEARAALASRLGG